MNNNFKYDLFRYYGKIKLRFTDKIKFPLELKYLMYLRKAQNSKNIIVKKYYSIILKKYSKKTHIQIPVSTKIGKGFYIGHLGRIIINPNVKIGENVNIATGVTIGKENRGKRKGVPTIKDNVWIGTNSVIVGNISIGSDVLIAPLSFVNFDVPDHSIVIGNPAKVIQKANATNLYIQNTNEEYDNFFNKK